MGKFKTVGKLLGLAPDKQAAPASLAQSTEADPAIEATRKRKLAADKLRQGRRASILTSRSGVDEPLGAVNRPQARAAQLFGE